MLPLQKTTRKISAMGVLMVDIICSLFVFPFATFITYQDGSFFVIMLLGFIIAVPIALIVGGLLIGLLVIVLESNQIPHMKNFMLESALFGAILGMLVGIMISAFSIKFSLAMAITGSIAGVLIALFTETKIETIKE